VCADVDAYDIFTIEIKNRSQIIFDPYRIDGFLVERGQVMDLMGTQSRIKGITLEVSVGFFG
jgi:hypothetical protein